MMTKMTKVNGRNVLTGEFNLSELKAGMQVFDTELGRFETVVSVISDGFRTFDKAYDKNNLGIIVPTQEKERQVADCFTRVPFVSGKKNFYVSFDCADGKYKRYSEDKIRRIDTVFLSKTDAWTLRNALNEMITPKVTLMRKIADDLDIQKIEKELANKYTRISFTAGVKNYYVSFDASVGKYKRYSEDTIRRIDTIFLSPSDASSLRDELNKAIVL